MRKPFWQSEEMWISLLGFGGILAALQMSGDIDVVDAVTSPVETVKDVFTRGSRLTYGTLSNGIILDSVDSLVSAASARMGRDISPDVYALARMIRSEGAAEGELRGHVALNDLGALGWSGILALITYSTDPQRKGMFGSQYSPASPPQYPNKMVRRYASSRDPYEGDILLAEKIIADHDSGIDPTQGATKFLDRSSFGVQEGTGSFDAKDAEWRSSGMIATTVPEFGTDFVLYRKA